MLTSNTITQNIKSGRKLKMRKRQNENQIYERFRHENEKWKTELGLVRDFSMAINIEKQNARERRYLKMKRKLWTFETLSPCRVSGWIQRESGRWMACLVVKPVRERKTGNSYLRRSDLRISHQIEPSFLMGPTWIIMSFGFFYLFIYLFSLFLFSLAPILSPSFSPVTSHHSPSIVVARP